MSKIKALILDAGGVLVHPYHGEWTIPMKYREFLGAYADDIPGEKWEKVSREEAYRIREDIIVPTMKEEYVMRLDFLRAVAARMDWQISEEAMLGLAHDFTYNPDRHAWYEDSIGWLKNWHGKYRIGILSDASPSFRPLVEKGEANDYVEAFVTSTQIGALKPDPRMYAEICNRMKIDPADCLFVDDKPCNLEGAMAYGMHAVQMCREKYEWTEWNGDILRNLSELNAYVEGLN